MQPSIDQLLKAYKMADYERRMFLFLEYRDLRDLFAEIDASELFFESQFPESSKPKTWVSWLKRCTVMKWSANCSPQSPAGQ